MPEGTTQGTTGSSTDWQQEAERLRGELAQREENLRGLAQERDRYRANWQRVQTEGGEVVQVDAQGNFVGFDTGEPTKPPSAYSGPHPFAGVVEDPRAVDGYFSHLSAQQLAAAGYVTAAQAEAMAQRAYQLARGDGQVWRTYDKLVAKADYADLAKPESELSKRTAAILKERNLARPLPNAQGFDEWQYGELGHLQFGADLARLQLNQEAQASAASAQQALQAQGAAGLSVGGGAGSPPPAAAGDVPHGATGGVDWDKLRADTEARAGALGVRV